MNKHISIMVVNADGDALHLSVSRDADAGEIVNLFRTIMTWLTYHPDTINEYLGDKED